MILDEISNELLSGFNLSNYTKSEIEEMKVNIIMNLYNKIILQTIESLDRDHREKLIVELKQIQPSYDEMLSIIEKYVPNLNEFISSIMIDYRQELSREFKV